MSGRKRVRTHGIAATYSAGCRCDACKAAAAAKGRRCRADRAMRAALGDDSVPHGTQAGYVGWYCRCVPCLEAYRAYYSPAAKAARAAARDREATAGVDDDHGQ